MTTSIQRAAGAAGPKRGSPGRAISRAVGGAGSLLLVIASRALVAVNALWARVPSSLQARVHAVLDPTGVPYVLGFLASYDKGRALSNFAGNLASLKAAYAGSSPRERAKLDRQLKGIVDQLVMKNGVTKSTHATRQNRILMKVLADASCQLRKSAITVLELPASIGITALENRAALSQRYSIGAYTLGDLFWCLYYDADRECVFDEEFNLLQVKLKKRYFGIYRAARFGERHRGVASVLMFPSDLVSLYLKRRFPYSETSRMVPVSVVHPDVEARIGTGDFVMKKLDVFSEIGDRYDVILCFNLLLRDYFREDQIATGTANLRDALHEEGLLIMGDEVSFSVARKREGKLVVIKQEGRF